jgi:creatinine amidohydrolase/Fe(II)-dependent formamide hydrolase-like protein
VAAREKKAPFWVGSAPVACSVACSVETTNEYAAVAAGGPFVTAPGRAGALAWILALLALAAFGSPAWAASSSLHIEDLTWPELRARIDGGATTILVPIGGTEQNGPHMVLGKHNVRARALAQRIAQQLGNALVAPVMAYVPEGAIDPPQAHMRFAGTLSIPEPAFEAVLEATARSFRRHGFREIVFLGDHGGYQKSEERVAARLNREWTASAATPLCRVHALAEYYRAATTGFAQTLEARGFGKDEIGTHAGLSDTALALAVDELLVRKELLGSAPRTGERDGVYGDPRRATAELGQLGVQRIVEASVAAIRERTRAR